MVELLGHLLAPRLQDPTSRGEFFDKNREKSRNMFFEKNICRDRTYGDLDGPSDPLGDRRGPRRARVRLKARHLLGHAPEAGRDGARAGRPDGHGGSLMLRGVTWKFSCFLWNYRFFKFRRFFFSKFPGINKRSLGIVPVGVGGITSH